MGSGSAKGLAARGGTGACFGRANRIAFRFVQWFALAFVRPYFRIRLEGREHLIDGPLIVAPNHRSYVDPLVLQTPIRSHRLIFMMTRSWYDVWFLKPVFLFFKCIPVEDEARNRKALERAIDLLKRGSSLGIYPEGQISLDGELGRFSPGVAALAMRTGVPIVPAGVVGTAQALPKGKLFPRPKQVIIRLGPALRPLSGEQARGMSRRQLMEELTQRLQVAVESLLA